MSKNYLIVGGSHGIGLEIVKQLAEENNVIVLSRTSDNLEGINSTHHKVDLTKETEFPKIEDNLDGLVYAPGTINLKPFNALKDSDFTNDFNINALKGVMTVKNYLSNLKRSENASIVFFSTVAVQTGMPYHTSIAMAKGAVEGMTRSLAAELAPKIRVNAVAPSLTDTPLADKLLNNDAKKNAAVERHPLKRYGGAEDIANAVIYLLSEKSSWMTGQILHVDGGLSALNLK
jgi:NAD(P)-dependent dehydrogenase (short-subunit alcohol dehydrogenase family)